MAKETERKFLVREEILTPLLAKGGFEKKHLSQFYLVATKEAAVRLRAEQSEGKTSVVLTVKAGGDGLTTNEFEFGIEEGLLKYFEEYKSRQGIEIRKTRYLVPHAGRTYEVDVFHGDLAGLVVAELEAEDAEAVVDLPEWTAEEVTYDNRYKNAVLALEGRPAGLDERVAASPEVFLELRALENPCVRIAGRSLGASRGEWVPPVLVNASAISSALDDLAELDAELLDLRSNDEAVDLRDPLPDDPAGRPLLAAAIGHQAWPDHLQEARVQDVLEALGKLDNHLAKTTETDSQKGN